MSWDKIIAFVLEYEGSTYEDDPNDLGGGTRYGISSKAFPLEDIKNMTEERAKQIYKTCYWDPLHCDELPEKLAMVMFDCAVNQGPRTAVKLLQRIYGLIEDGVMGPITVGAVKNATDQTVWYYLLFRARQYLGTKTVEHWGANWGLRLTKLAKLTFELANS